LSINQFNSDSVAHTKTGQKDGQKAAERNVNKTKMENDHDD